MMAGVPSHEGGRMRFRAWTCLSAIQTCIDSAPFLRNRSFICLRASLTSCHKQGVFQVNSNVSNTCNSLEDVHHSEALQLIDRQNSFTVQVRDICRVWPH